LSLSPNVSLSALSGWFVLAVAVAAVNRPAFAGLKGHFGVLTALGAHGGEHLALPVAATAGAVTILLPCLPARGASLWLVGVAFGLEELLLFSAEVESRPAIGTRELLVLKSQRMTSFLRLVG
jgi:hypothetical protein